MTLSSGVRSRSARCLGREELAEIVALHDRERLMDYVTCGTGGHFDFFSLIPSFQYPEKLGADRRRAGCAQRGDGDP